MNDARRTAAMMDPRWPDAMAFVKSALKSLGNENLPHSVVRDAAVKALEALPPIASQRSNASGQR